MKTVKITATFEVSVDDVLRANGADVNDPDALSDAISGEFGWVHDSGMFLTGWEFVPENEHPNGDKPGICPVCGEEIYYEDRELMDDNTMCSWECEHCGAYGKLSEDIVFDQHYEVYDADGNRILTGRNEGIDGVALRKEETLAAVKNLLEKHHRRYEVNKYSDGRMIAVFDNKYNNDRVHIELNPYQNPCGISYAGKAVNGLDELEALL